MRLPWRLIRAVSDVCGVQAQGLTAAELTIGARVTGVTQRAIEDALWRTRRLVKTYGPRGSLHLLPANEVPLWTAAIRALPLGHAGAWYSQSNLTPLLAQALFAAVRDALDGRALTRTELADAVSARLGPWVRERCSHRLPTKSRLISNLKSSMMSLTARRIFLLAGVGPCADSRLRERAEQSTGTQSRMHTTDEQHATPQEGGVNISGGQISARDIIGGNVVGYTAVEVRALLQSAIQAAHEQAPVASAPRWNELDAHYKTVIKALSDGRVVPFLGAGANLVGRPANAPWLASHFLPSGGELAEYLAGDFDYPSPDKQDLLRVAQYVAVMNGMGPLYEQLRTLFDSDYAPTAMHQLLAMLPPLLRAKGYPRPCLLIVSTNYDDLIERTFRSVGEPFDVVTYVADGDQRGKFVHWPHGETPRVIASPNDYTDLPIEMPSCNLQRSLILRLHGAVNRADADSDSYVITEDHYIDYLARKDVSNPIPTYLVAKLRKSNFLFMGYSLRDWNLRVILQRLWGEQQLSYTSWAIQANAEALEQKYWGKRNVDIFNLRLEDYVAQLTTLLSALPPFGGKS